MLISQVPATRLYTDRAEAEAEVRRLNSLRKRANIEYVVGTRYNWNEGGKVHYVGVCSDDCATKEGRGNEWEQTDV